MKRSPELVAFFVGALMLSACASPARASSRFGSGDGILTPGTKLALGTIKLEGTPQAIDPATAAKLLPLWQLLLQLDSSTTAAPQEITAVLDQIQATLTPDQANAIKSMQITSADMVSAFQPQGGAAGTNATRGTRTPGAAGGNRNGGGQAFFFGGGGGPGGIPGGGFGGGGNRSNAGNGSGTASGAQTGTSQRSQNSIAVPGFLVNQVITLLESKIRG